MTGWCQGGCIKLVLDSGSGFSEMGVVKPILAANPLQIAPSAVGTVLAKHLQNIFEVFAKLDKLVS